MSSTGSPASSAGFFAPTPQQPEETSLPHAPQHTGSLPPSSRKDLTSAGNPPVWLRYAATRKLPPGRNYQPNNKFMGIDVYARWKGQTDEDERSQCESALTATAGRIGYLREAYHGEPYATHFLVQEAYEGGIAFIPARTLRARLPETLRLAEVRERTIYKASTAEEIQPVLQSYTEFVELCERKEAETGEPVEIMVWY